MGKTKSDVSYWNMLEIDIFNYKAIDLLERLGQKQPSQRQINLVERVLEGLDFVVRRKRFSGKNRVKNI